MAVSSLDLLQCFGIGLQTRLITIVGAGGKTSLMYALAREMQGLGKKVVTTTTTKIYPPEPHQSPALVLLRDDPDLETLPCLLDRVGSVTVGQSILQSGKLEGITDATFQRCLTYADWILVEGDGASGQPVKAPEPWEPVIPAFTDIVIPVVGLDCVGRPASEQWVFRLNRFLAVTGLTRGERITPSSIAVLLRSPEGGLKGVPEKAEVVPFLNKKDRLDKEWDLDETANMILAGVGDRISRLVVGRLRGEIRVRVYSKSAFDHPPDATVPQLRSG